MLKSTILVFIIYVLLAFNKGQAQPAYFKNYQTTDGLSNNTITSITQDRQGFLWIGSRNGLNRFDGNRFKIFRHQATDSLSLGSSSILSLLTDSEGKIWVGTTRGLYTYNPIKENFNLIKQIPQGEIRFIKAYAGYIWVVYKNTLYQYSVQRNQFTAFNDDKNITAINSSPHGGLWILNNNQVLKKYNQRLNRFTEVNLQKINIKIPTSIRAIHGINDSLVLIGTNRTAYLIDINKGTLKDLFTKEQHQASIQINSISQHSASNFWFGTETGIYTYDLQTHKSQHIKKDDRNPFSISDNVVYDFYTDKEGNTWIATFFGGLTQYSNHFDNFKKYFSGFGSPSLSGNIVHEIQKDKEGKLWVGTEDNGLNRINLQSGAIEHFTANGKPGSITYNNIHGLTTVNDELWIGTTTNGLSILDLKTGKLKRSYPEIADGNVRSKFVVTLYKTSNNKVYIGTDNGLFTYDSKKETFKLLPLKTAWIQGIYEDREGLLWINTYGSGVIIFNPRTQTTQNILADAKKPDQLINNYVNGLFEDSNKNIWFCTEGGVTRYRRDGQFKNYPDIPSLSSNQTFKALEDDNHSIWISTSNGLVKLNDKEDKAVLYTAKDGLPTDQFNYNSAYKDTDGTLYFGTLKGMISFNPSKSFKNDYVPPLLISDIQINNKEVLVGGNSPLQQSISLTKELRLSYDKSNISFAIASLSFVSPESNVYSYIMEGYDKQWTTIKGNQKIYYNKLPPGDYIFKFIGTNNNNVWNKEVRQIRIFVSPPWWQSRLAYGLYAIFIAAIIALILRYYFLWMQANQSRKMELFEHKKEQEIYNLKLEFFTNLAHEIRTPLALIKMPLEKIIRTEKNLNHDTIKDLALMERSTTRLIRLTNQLLDFRKAESNAMNLIFTKTDINALLSEIFNDLLYLAQEKSLTYELSLPRISLTAYVDEEACRKIFTNLIHNAIKYAEREVKVKLLPFNSDDIMFNVEFRNDGELIPYDKKDKIFEPFYRLNESGKDTGTGIGLPLSRSLIELHKGTIALMQTDEKRNLFLLSCPILQDQSLDIPDFQEELSPITEAFATPEKEDGDVEKPNILIVEDNKEILAYLNKELKLHYNIRRATNGVEALDILDNESIQLVLTDIMMPIMDGIALCKRIKTDFLYSHIPVIFLTAKNTLNSKIEALNSGADAYIEKPFSIAYLTVQIQNILKNRNMIKKYFTNALVSDLLEVNISAPDKDFIGQLNQVIYDNIATIDLNVEELAKLMNMSRPTLYRKIKGLSDLTPNELINMSRLKKAAELLHTKEYNISQVAIMVGYTVQSNFSRDFHKHFGMTPSVYITENEKKKRGL